RGSGALLLAQQRVEHTANSRCELQDRVRVFVTDGADGKGQIDGGDGFAEAVAGFDEVLVAQGCAVIWQAFRQAKEAALGRSRSLIAQLSIAELRLLDEPSELARGDVHIELLKRKEILSFHVDLLPNAAGGRST